MTRMHGRCGVCLRGVHAFLPCMVCAWVSQRAVNHSEHQRAARACVCCAAAFATSQRRGAAHAQSDGGSGSDVGKGAQHGDVSWGGDARCMCAVAACSDHQLQPSSTPHFRPPHDLCSRWTAFNPAAAPRALSLALATMQIHRSCMSEMLDGAQPTLLRRVAPQCQVCVGACYRVACSCARPGGQAAAAGEAVISARAVLHHAGLSHQCAHPAWRCVGVPLCLVASATAQHSRCRHCCRLEQQQWIGSGPCKPLEWNGTFVAGCVRRRLCGVHACMRVHGYTQLRRSRGDQQVIGEKHSS